MQEITVIVMIDTQAALENNLLEDHIYLIDNLRTEGSIGEGTKDLTSKVNGAYWSDGSQAGEYLFNWLPYPIASISPILPKTYKKDRAKAHDVTNLERLQNIAQSTKENATKDFSELTSKIGRNLKIKNELGEISTASTKLMGLNGDILPNNYSDPANMITHLTPQITNITGEAVDKGIIYPAQYGTPVPIKDGWYWSASTASKLVGTYKYTMHITLFKPSVSKGEIIWTPKYFTHDAQIEIVNAPMVNGFTKAGVTFLPII